MEEQEIQVVLLPAIQPAFKAWLHSRGLYLFRIPGLPADDFPTYAIGISAEKIEKNHYHGDGLFLVEGPRSSCAYCQSKRTSA